MGCVKWVSDITVVYVVGGRCQSRHLQLSQLPACHSPATLHPLLVVALSPPSSSSSPMPSRSNTQHGRRLRSSTAPRSGAVPAAPHRSVTTFVPRIPRFSLHTLLTLHVHPVPMPTPPYVPNPQQKVPHTHHTTSQSTHRRYLPSTFRHSRSPHSSLPSNTHASHYSHPPTLFTLPTNPHPYIPHNTDHLYTTIAPSLSPF